MAARTLSDIKRLNDGLDLCLNLLKERFHVLWIGTGEFVLDDEPRNRIQIDTRDLEAQTRPFNERGAPAHEAVEHFKILKFSAF